MSYNKNFYIPKTSRDNLLDNDLKSSNFFKVDNSPERRDEVFNSLMKDIKTL